MRRVVIVVVDTCHLLVERYIDLVAPQYQKRIYVERKRRLKTR